MCVTVRLFLLSLAVVAAACVNDSLEDCASQLSMLEEALYQTGDNLFQLNHIFFPPSMRTSRFILVTYVFLNETGGDNGCNVTYIWAIGGFLFFQPPAIFTLNSLFFNYPSNNLTDLYLQLPEQCRGLVQPNVSRSLCTCRHGIASERLDILTQQLNIYAGFPNRDQITREHTFARATCAEELEDIYYNGNNPSFVFIIVGSTIVLPLIILILLVAAVKKIDKNIANSFVRASSHGTIVAAILTGIVLTAGILMTNIMSCIIVLEGNHEYSPFIEERSINLYIVFGTLACNILFALPLLFCLLYITVCFNARGLLRRLCCNMVCSLHPCISRFVAFIVGQYVFDKIGTLSKNSVVSLMFPLMMATPILCLSSHMGYIMLAWLTEPSKCTASFLLYYASVMYLFFAFRKLYNVHSGIKLSSNLSKKVKESQADSEVASPDGKDACSPDDSTRGWYHRIIHRSDKQHVNTQTFCLLISYSFVIIGLALIFILVFVLLPISSENLVTYIFQLLQLMVVLVSTQFAYRLFFGSSFSLEGVVSKFKEVYAEKGGDERLSAIARQRHEELSDVAGQFAAELTDVIIRKAA